MDCRNGDIRLSEKWDEKEMEQSFEEALASKRLLALSSGDTAELSLLPKRLRKSKMRNKPCVCGSGKKFKRCCWNKYTSF